MTKREYLESIGYKREIWCFEENPELFWKCYKGLTDRRDTTMYIDLAKNKYFIELTYVEKIENQKQIDDLQIAFNNVKRDFKEMQKYEED